MGLPVEASTGCAFIISPGPPQAPRPSLLELETAGKGREVLLGRGSAGQDGLVQVTQLSVAKPERGPETLVAGVMRRLIPARVLMGTVMAKAGCMDPPGVTAHCAFPQVLTLRR